MVSESDRLAYCAVASKGQLSRVPEIVQTELSFDKIIFSAVPSMFPMSNAQKTSAFIK